jgi:hypothetical protein
MIVMRERRERTDNTEQRKRKEKGGNDKYEREQRGDVGKGEERGRRVKRSEDNFGISIRLIHWVSLAFFSSQWKEKGEREKRVK